MPRQNRVTPLGEIIATPERGTFMGNRGVLHDEEGTIRRAWQVKRWLLCLLEFRGRHRSVMTPGDYTELFLLDEATGLAAGHRPCFECRRERFLAFQEAWRAGRSGNRKSSLPTAGEMDDRLHAYRVGPDRTKITFQARLDDVPDGVLVQRLTSPGEAYLIWKRSLLLWSPGGYQRKVPYRAGEEVLVLTPRSTVRAIRAGYDPEVHFSVGKV
ncbi:hypothetical protein AYO44_16975 [Planctomycetaceae bacterium SCGC AG-212-F19]|nr:hypothetical protein AYO44_16975 [Planctomycetaceae bacterium SCGC AG-212-F19]